MGKGFHCSKDVLSHDLGEIIEQSCQRAVGVHFFIREGAMLTLR